MINLDCVADCVYDGEIVFNTVKEDDEDFYDDFLHMFLTDGFEAYNMNGHIRQGISSCQKLDV